MKAIPVRTGSFQVHSPTVSLCRNRSFSESAGGSISPRVSLNPDHKRVPAPIRRALSEASLRRSSGAASRTFPARIPEEEKGVGSRKGKKSGGGGNNHKNGDENARSHRNNSIREYYEKILESNPGESLILRNYAKFLSEVEGDTEKAEEYYGRAVLASPGDGEVLALYGKLVWDITGDEERALGYFERAALAAPEDCMVLGSCAHFMWEVEEASDEEERVGDCVPVVAAF